jgi:hypothetical protein
MAATGNGHYLQHTAADDNTEGRYKVSHIIWHGFTDATHTIQIKDAAGDIVIPAIACGAAAAVIGIITIPVGKWINGPETDVLDSGTAVYVLS